MTIELTIDGELRRLSVPAHWTLLEALRDAGATDVKHGCGEGVCGACAVILDDAAVSACCVLVAQAAGREVRTAAGLCGADGSLHPLQDEMAARGAVQCGFCTPGMTIAAVEAVEIGAAASRDEIRHSLAGNLCRCTGYRKIVDAVEAYRDRCGAIA